MLEWEGKWGGDRNQKEENGCSTAKVKGRKGMGSDSRFLLAEVSIHSYPV